jgi:hypothetical protein
MAEHGRESGSGRYTYTRLEQVCTCGHRLGVHAAARLKEGDKASQPCFNADPGDGDGTACACECFTPARKRAQ